MEKEIFEQIEKTCTDLGWYVERGNGQIELSIESNAGEDFSISLSEENFFSDLENYDFNPEKHVEMWIEAKHNGMKSVPTAFVLVEDAKWLEGEIENLKIVLNSMELIYTVDGVTIMRCNLCGTLFKLNDDVDKCPICGGDVYKEETIKNEKK